MWALLALALVLACSTELLPYNPVAAPGAVVVAGNARFTVLTERIVRMEYATNGRFEDRPSLAIVNRFLDVPPFQQSSRAGVLTVATRFFTLSYALGALSFTSATLNVTGANFSYHFGDVDHGNLFGTIRSLDQIDTISLNCSLIAHKTVHSESLHCRYGVASRGGFALIDDSENTMLDSRLQWWQSRNTNRIDTYLFTHGNDYMGAVAEFSLLSGRVAMMPRGALGTMWSRWFDYSGLDLMQRIVAEYEQRALPLDALILDMDWHRKPHVSIV